METEQLMNEIDEILQTIKEGTVSISHNGETDSRCMTFYIKDYALYSKIEKDSLILEDFAQNPFVHITLGGDKLSDNYLEITGETEVVTDSDMIDWLRKKGDLAAVASDMVMLKVMVQKVKLVDEENGKRRTKV